MMRQHLDLFSGIGGFALAADAVWPGIRHTFVERSEFCQAILRRHWAGAPIHGDIGRFIADAKERYDGRCHASQGGRQEPEPGNSHGSRAAADPGREYGRPGIKEDAQGISAGAQRYFLVTGGFPCQPFSQAGRRQGTADDRYLWPAMLECVKLVRPTWVIAENVAGLLTWNDILVFETVCADLEAEGYEVWPFVIPAVAVGAPHKRDRVWVVAHALDDRPWRTESGGSGTSCPVPQGNRADDGATRQLERTDSNGQVARSEWNADWRAVASATCVRGVDDGIPRQMDSIAISGARWRREALKALGNAIVPQVAEMIMRAISESESA